MAPLMQKCPAEILEQQLLPSGPHLLRGSGKQHSKGLTEEEEGTAAGLTCPQQRLLETSPYCWTPEDVCAEGMGQNTWESSGIFCAGTCLSVWERNGKIREREKLPLQM
ncbi:hypothetical protein ILYODFUR_023310 [Ilyodon furcidens]|uniref:Uncharacterized protein n=1 Tax=Ilyodon furcidens TaxID=33524 RepID=A0ABV0UJ07_9TELE